MNGLMKTSGLVKYIILIIILCLGFAAIASAGVTTVIKDWHFLKFVFWIALVVGGWVVSGVVAYTAVKIKIRMHDKGIFTLNKNIDTNKKETETIITDIKNEFNSKLYNKDGSTIYMPKKECDKEQAMRERRHDDGQRILFSKIENLEKQVGRLTESQTMLAVSVSNLVGRFDQYLKGEEERNSNG